MHPFASGSSIVTLTRHPSGGSTGGSGNNTTLAFTDSDGNVITSVVDGTSSAESPPGGVTIVTTDSLVGSHFLTSDQGVVTKLEMDDVSNAPAMEVVVKKKGSSVPESEKKVCLWPTGNGTTCGKTFTKFDSLKRHLAEAHKGVRPYACTLCDKTYGRRDYLQRHLKSHNTNYAVNLASSSGINASQVVQTVSKVQVNPKPTIIVQQGQGGTLQVLQQQQVQQPQQQQQQQQQQPSSITSLPFLSLNPSISQPHKPLGSKICRWVQNDGTVCGKAFSKLDSLRRHVNELHKGVRPFACTLCDKNYGRRDYLDRHLKTHDPDNQKRKLSGGIDWGPNSGVLMTGEDGETLVKKIIKKKRKDIPAEEKKICLWVLEDGTACGKTFTKFDSLKRHVSEAHKGVRPFACTLCGKNYGRRDYLLRHLKSHNEAEVASISTTRIVGTNNQVVGHMVGGQGGGSGGGGGLTHTTILHSPSVVSSNPGVGVGVVGSSGGQIQAIRVHNNKKRLSDKKTCRWVLDNGTVCGRTFSKFDSLRRHVQELHKGVRPFICQLCDKSYGRRDYLDRHMKSHTAGAGAGSDSGVTITAIDDDDHLNDVVTVAVADDDLTV